MKKTRLNRLKFWKNRPVWFGFGFISLKPKKKPNRTQTRKKQSQTGKKRAKLKKTEPKREKKRAKTEPNWFEPVFILKN